MLPAIKLSGLRFKEFNPHVQFHFLLLFLFVWFLVFVVLRLVSFSSLKTVLYFRLVLLLVIVSTFEHPVQCCTATLLLFLCSLKVEHIVAAFSVHLFHFCPEHSSKRIEGNLMKLDTLIENHWGDLQNASTITLSPVFTDLLPFLIFARKSLSEAYLWKYRRDWMKLDTLIDGHHRKCRVQES